MSAQAERWIQTFLEAAAAELDTARNTQLAYGRDLLDFGGFLDTRGVTFETTQEADIIAYMVSVEAEGLAQSTRARRLSSIKQLFRFAYEEGWRSDNPALQIKGPGKSKRLPKVLTHADVDQLLTAAAQGRNGLRNSCLMQVLYATGLRVTELVTLPLTAARGDPQMLLVRGKGGKERLVPLSTPARAAMAEWLTTRDAQDEAATQQGHPTSRFLFPGGGAAGHLTRQQFYRLVKDIAVAGGVDPSKVTPHTLRHAFATHLLAGGADLRTIQTMLGHADISTTEIYTQVLDERLKKLVLSHHPLAGN